MQLAGAQRETGTCQSVQPPKTGLQGIGKGSNAGSVRDIQLMEDDAGEPERLELLDGLCTSRLVSGRQNDREAAAGQLPAHLETDPLVAAGDDGDTTVPAARRSEQFVQRYIYTREGRPAPSGTANLVSVGLEMDLSMIGAPQVRWLSQDQIGNGKKERGPEGKKEKLVEDVMDNVNWPIGQSEMAT